MSNDNIRILGDVEISSALTFKQDLSVFPSNPKPRTMVVKDGQPYIYAEVSHGSGYFSWLPVGAKQNSYLHSQGLESTTWTVSHGLNTTDFAYFVYDNNHVLVLANATVIDANTVQINLSEAITGTVIVFGVAHVVVPGVTAVDNVTINSIVLRDTNGVLTVNNNAVAFAGAVTSSIDAEAAVRAAADIVLQNNINTEAGLRAAGDTAAIATAAADATIKADAAAVSAVTTVKTYLGAVTEDIVPATDLGANLGSPTKQFHSLYVGPGTLYVNGKAVIQDNSDTMTFGTDPDQNMRLQTSGSGHLELQAASGTIDIKGTMSIESGKRIVDSAGTQVQFGDDVQMNSNKVIGLGAPLAATDAATKGYVDGLTTNDSTLVRTSGAQSISGLKTFTDDITVSGNLVVSGTTTTVNSETIKLADNLIDLNSNYVAGAPTENAGIRIMRGDEAASQVRWNEATDKWEVSADSSTFSVIAVTADVTAATAAAATDATTKANAAQAAAIAAAATDATNKVATEATARATGDTTNANAIATEATARANADTALDGRVTTVEGQVNGKIGDLTTLTTSDKLSLVAAINETDANADAASTAIAAETTRATGVEGTLTTNLANEVTARISGDAAAISTASADATTKANAAQAAAIAAAATDATNKVATETTRATAAEALLAPKASPTFTGTVSGITKAMVGLGSVDNTADSAKPVSTAQQAALNLKANLASPAFTGTPTAATAAAGTNTTQVATTAFVAAVQAVAATDATTKANAAQAAAISTAATDATTKANAAQAAAISTAATDATTKANAAQAAAATDATTKANAAQAAAISTAATDATNKANAAQAAAIAAVTNGAGAAFDTLKEIQDAMATDAELAAAISAITVGNATQTITAGAGMTGGGSFTANQTANSSVTISHADTSTVTSLTALTGAAVVSDLDFDTYGHVTGVATRTMTLGDLGYTGATNANYVTNNNQLTNGAGYITSGASISGNAGTATALQTARAINGVNFNGTAAITVEPYVEDDESTNATRLLTFVDNTTAGFKRLNEDSTLNYNPSTGTLSATVFSGVATTARYADLAENYVADAEYVPGTVVVFGGEKEITVTDQSHDARVAGVISTNPAYLMNSDCDGLPVAFTGRVPCLVQGPVNKGDVLVTSSTPGVAQAIGDSFKPGCVIGKSLESIADNSTLLIEVVVGRF